MPRPRFFKLAADKRERILRTAGRAFAERGYERATINHMLGQAGISTGAAYYYFDNKADLFTAALTFYIDELVASTPPKMGASDADAFWIEFGAIVGESMARANDVHRTVAALRSAWKISPELADLPDIAEQFARNDALLRAFFHRGRDLGAIRTDLPDTLLLRCGLAVDEAFDDWMEKEVKARGRPLHKDELVKLMGPLVNMLRAMFSPPRMENAGGPANQR